MTDRNHVRINRIKIVQGILLGIWLVIGLTTNAFAKAGASDFSEAYQSSVFYERLQKVTRTGNYRKDIIQIALSQVGYQEGSSPEDLGGTTIGSKKNYTEYGNYFGNNGSPWCSEFACWCIRMAGVSDAVVADSIQATPENFAAPCYSWSQSVFAGGEYQPRAGDLALFSRTGTYGRSSSHLSHTALIRSVKVRKNKVSIRFVEGNTGKGVKCSTFVFDKKNGLCKKGRLVCFIAPRYESAAKKKKSVLWFQANGGSVSQKTKEVAKQGIYGVLPVPRRKNYKFLGWYTAKIGGKKVTPYQRVKFLGSQTLYAHWSPIVSIRK